MVPPRNHRHSAWGGTFLSQSCEATMTHPSTGPLEPEELRALAAGPFGRALEVIRKHDPLYGRKEGELIDWVVKVRCKTEGQAVIKAASLKHAKTLADNLTEAEIDWDWPVGDDFEIISITPESPLPCLAKAVPAAPSLFQRGDGAASNSRETAQSEPKPTVPS
jgi:hypothetical protein